MRHYRHGKPVLRLPWPSWLVLCLIGGSLLVAIILASYEMTGTV